MQDVDDSSLLAAAICEAIAAQTGDDRARECVQIVREKLAPLVAAALTGRSAAAVAHELRNPLAVIATSAAILAQRVSDDERARKHLQRIDAQVRIASSLALDLLEGASPRAVNVERAELVALLGECLENVSLPATFVVRVSAPTAPCYVRVDRRRTAQIVVNLLQNARAACHDHGEAHLEITVERPYVLLLVRDNGPGIPSDSLERIFAVGESKSAKGHGLGLAIAREFARAQGGDLAARAHDHGALFALTMRADTEQDTSR